MGPLCYFFIVLKLSPKLSLHWRTSSWKPAYDAPSGPKRRRRTSPGPVIVIKDEPEDEDDVHFVSDLLLKGRMFYRRIKDAFFKNIACSVKLGWYILLFFIIVPRHESCIIVADRSSPVLAPACPTAAPGHSQSFGSCQRHRPPQHQFPNLRAHLGKCRFPSRHWSQRLKRGRRQRTIPTRTGALSVRTEESCSVVTSVPKFFIWRVTSPLSTSPLGKRQAVSQCCDCTT